MFLSKKNIIVLFCLSALSLLLVLNTNARRVSDSHLLLEKAMEQSQYLDGYLKTSRLSQKAKSIILRQKLLVDDYIAVNTKSKNCQELLRNAPTLRSGIYTLGNDRNKTYCEIKAVSATQGTVMKVNSTLNLTKKRAVTGCDAKKSCVKERDFYKLVTCESTKTTQHFCSFIKGIGRPIIITNKGSRQCRESDYGFSREKGLWIKNGCAGVFKMKIRSPIEV